MGKAGSNRWRGIRPRTRGVAMNPVDHPMGGGEGRLQVVIHVAVPVSMQKGENPDKRKGQ